MSNGSNAAMMPAANKPPFAKSTELLACVVILLALSALFRFTDLDVRLGSLFFSPEAGWKYATATLFSLLYDYGEWPGLLLSIMAAAVLGTSFFVNNLSRFRKPAVFIVLLLVIGPGFVVNGFLKYYGGRPRPRDVAVFAGTQPFHKLGEKGEAGQGYSFPSGHASMGFFLGAPYFILRKSSRRWAFFWLLLGLTAGAGIGVARMAQGGHFASDIVWAWGIVHLCGLALLYLLNLENGSSTNLAATTP